MSRVKWIAVVVVVGVMLLGCSQQDVAKLTAARNDVVSEVADAKSAEAALRTQVAALPANDPVRKALEPRLAQLHEAITRGEQYLPVVDGAIQSAQSRQIDPSLTTAASAVPYGSLVLAAVGLVWGTIKHIQASGALEQHAQTQQAFQQVVGALDAALPEPSAAQKTAIAGALDADVKAKVAAARAT